MDLNTIPICIPTFLKLCERCLINRCANGNDNV